MNLRSNAGRIEAFLSFLRGGGVQVEHRELSATERWRSVEMAIEDKQVRIYGISGHGWSLAWSHDGRHALLVTAPRRRFPDPLAVIGEMFDKSVRGASALFVDANAAAEWAKRELQPYSHDWTFCELRRGGHNHYVPGTSDSNGQRSSWPFLGVLINLHGWMKVLKLMPPLQVAILRGYENPEAGVKALAKELRLIRIRDDPERIVFTLGSNSSDIICVAGESSRHARQEIQGPWVGRPTTGADAWYGPALAIRNLLLSRPTVLESLRAAAGEECVTLERLGYSFEKVVRADGGFKCGARLVRTGDAVFLHRTSERFRRLRATSKCLWWGGDPGCYDLQWNTASRGRLKLPNTLVADGDLVGFATLRMKTISMAWCSRFRPERRRPFCSNARTSMPCSASSSAVPTIRQSSSSVRRRRPGASPGQSNVG
ncbi:MAG: hypothetical protein U0136_03325 [Bdellovibrionota bacterium]